MKKNLLCSFFLFWAYILGAQQTMGLFQNSPESFNGYTLFAPSNYKNTYLIDNCGRLVNEWFGDKRPTSTYLLESGNLLRVGIIPNAFSAGGSAGQLEIFDWESNLLWSYRYSALGFHQHHDVEPLPNGNILLVAWEYHSMQDAIEMGRNPTTISTNGIWSEHVAEIKPIGSDSAEIVWMWRVWDHLVQDLDTSLNNYGVISENPQLFDINYRGITTNPSVADWLHINSIDYNPNLNQIMLSSRVWGEIWVIDHSTTTAEAATHMGGNSGRGGDILYRWGNPASYQLGTEFDQKFFGQHDAHWIQEGKPDAGKIMVFNNGLGRPGGSYSSFDIIKPPLNSDGTYELQSSMAFAPENLHWTYSGGAPFDGFFSPTVSGVQQQPNGNFLACIGRGGQFIEVDSLGNTVWEYICPVQSAGPITQGNPVGGNSVFKINKYSPEYAGLQGKNLSPGSPIELFPLFVSCEIYTPTKEVYKPIELQISPNPCTDYITIKTKHNEGPIQIFTSLGKKIHQQDHNEVSTISTVGWSKGVYFLYFKEKIFNFIVQ